jgi:UDP-N-acetylglucosamine 2-epimerase (non-hydrolysing)
VLRVLDARGVPYRAIDSGQHAELLGDLRVELGLRAPDLSFGRGRDVNTVPEALRWSASLGAKALGRERLRRDVFGPGARLCIVHGDTPSTLLSTMLARRAGLEVAHLEAGLRSRSILHPFPEELIRVAVMRASSILFAPNEEAVANLEAMRVRGRIVRVPGNTSIDALRASLLDPPEPGSGPVVVTMHRVENLHRRSSVEGFLALALRIAADRPVRFVVHGPTEAVLARQGRAADLAASGIELVPLAPHREFVRQLAAAPLVVTDGGSVQEECALLGVPTLLWRQRTERSDGLGANVVLTRYDRVLIEEFLADPDRWRRPPAWAHLPSPAEAIVDHLVAHRSPAAA